MKLYYFPVAPNPTRVRIYLAEKGTEVEQVLVDLRKGEQSSRSEHLERNPFGNLPVLELDDGRFLTESLAIMELFEELYPDPPMLGRYAHRACRDASHAPANRRARRVGTDLPRSCMRPALHSGCRRARRSPSGRVRGSRRRSKVSG